LAYPANYLEHEHAGKVLSTAHHQKGGEVLDLTLRGEYLYAACGPDGFVVYDVANIHNKGYSDPVSTAPVSPLGQRAYVRTPYATAVALPSTLAIDPARQRLPENEEQPIHLSYAFVYVADREEGLVIVNVATLVDGNPENNFLKKDVVYNPEALFTGATHVCFAGHRLYLTSPRGLFVVDVDDPLHPKLIGRAEGDALKNPRAVAIQFRYAFISDDEGLKVYDITEPNRPRPIAGPVVPLRAAGRPYLARTYAYVPNGAEGLAIVDIENPEQPRLDQMFTAEGQLNDVRAVQVGAVNASTFALVADGRNGFRVLQIISPENVPGYMGFSPRPAPELVAAFPTSSPAVAISRGLDRDRVVDETGHQTVVFGRRGARPFNVQEMARFYRPSSTNAAQPVYTVEDVLVRGGELKTRSGRLLSPTIK
jgi:hypothetical protein